MTLREPVIVESLDHEGRGVAHDQGKAIFINGALPGELVTYSPYRKKPNYEFAQLDRLIRPSTNRVTPKCPHYGTCGGCLMQHFDFSAQVAAKQRILEENLEHIGRVKADVMLPPLYGPAWRYRHRARLSVRFVNKKGGALVGFRERNSTFVTAMDSCEVLPARVSEMLPKMARLIERLSAPDRIPQIEIAVGEAVTVLVVRHLEPLDSASDQTQLRHFAEQEGVQVWLQPKGPESAYPFWPLHMPELYYTLPEGGLKIYFSPTDFTQVNPVMNRALVSRAIGLLGPQHGERVLDLFCGLGNFTLAIAKRVDGVVGVEGSDRLVGKARENARRNDLSASFETADLFSEKVADTFSGLGRFDKVLIDPPREGAIEVVKYIDLLAPKRIVYVSCSPATLARDAGVLVHTKGYELTQAGVINMFPHTGHVESIAVFDSD